MTVISDHRGRVRGYVADPSAHPPPRAGKLDVGGRRRDGHSRGRPLPPELARAVHRDRARSSRARSPTTWRTISSTSEQTPSALAAGVFVQGDGSVAAAGGYLVQALPGADEDVLTRLERTVRALPSPTELVRAGLGADGLIDALLDGIGSRARERSRPEFFCALRHGEDPASRHAARPRRDARDRRRRRALDVRCEFCATNYRARARRGRRPPAGRLRAERWTSRCSFRATSTSSPRASGSRLRGAARAARLPHLLRPAPDLLRPAVRDHRRARRSGAARARAPADLRARRGGRVSVGELRRDGSASLRRAGRRRRRAGAGRAHLRARRVPRAGARTRRTWGRVSRTAWRCSRAVTGCASSSSAGRASAPRARRRKGLTRAPAARVAGLELCALPRRDECCGFGGAFSVGFPELSARIGRDKLRGAGRERRRVRDRHRRELSAAPRRRCARARASGPRRSTWPRSSPRGSGG